MSACSSLESPSVTSEQDLCRVDIVGDDLVAMQTGQLLPASHILPVTIPSAGTDKRIAVGRPGRLRVIFQGLCPRVCLECPRSGVRPPELSKIAMGEDLPCLFNRMKQN